MVCKGICTRYKAAKLLDGSRYYSGQRCQLCEIFIEWDGLWCPCCGYRLRTKPRNSRHKQRLRDRLTVVPAVWVGNNAAYSCHPLFY